MNNLDKLSVWHKAIDLAEQVYRLVSKFPANEKYGLTSQIKRSVVSVSSNIAEGAGRNSAKEFIYFLGIANGSLFELHSQLVISQRLGLIQEDALNKITEEK